MSESPPTIPVPASLVDRLLAHRFLAYTPERMLQLLSDLNDARERSLPATAADGAGAKTEGKS